MRTEELRFDSLADLDRVLAVANKLVRAQEGLLLIFDVAPLAADRLMSAAVASWLRRRAPELRARVQTIEILMPSWMTTTYMRLEMFAARPPVRVTVRRAPRIRSVPA